MFVLAAGCSYVPPINETPDDGTSADGPLPDTTEVATCAVVPTGMTTEQGSVGGGGGGPRTDLACPEGELPIGAEFETSIGTSGIFNNQQVVVTTHIRCGRIARTTTNTMVTTPTARVTRLGGTCAGQVMLSGEQTCPSGAVMVGIQGNESGGSASSYNSVRIVCAPLATDGSIGAATTTLDFRPLTGNFSNDEESSICPEGTAVVRFGGKAGCTQDQIFAKCMQLTCD